ncbi:MAG: 16S rRNA (adenine(1518)-N(6)/adenine(1519)-N(6))-dimethyltransferase RsmA [Candidatus Nealsonbacteria bacterium DGGOD1a]|nr:MAG: 16S rRNA (adenine(1518)-N(6)/adenine(1519)-N(6))-dimethyltransferase RsmA [Candidatus Nealsonbacteria bacterium DGGOD1a]
MHRKLEKKQTITPKKGLGQNFLTQIGVIEKLVKTAGIKQGETILEIGPGTGNLTAELAKRGDKIIAIEKDADMMAILEKRFLKTPNVEISNGNALRFNEAEISSPYKIAANLPFYLTAPLIRKFLESANPPLSLTVIVQKEVAQRICAVPPKMNLLAVSTQFYAAAKIIDYISKGNFWPVPKVDCAILQVIPRTHIYEGGGTGKKFTEQFFKIVKAGFSHPRKQLANNLAKQLKLNKEKIAAWLAGGGIDSNRRAETLTVADWVKLTQTRPMDYTK